MEDSRGSFRGHGQRGRYGLGVRRSMSGRGVGDGRRGRGYVGAARPGQQADQLDDLCEPSPAEDLTVTDGVGVEPLVTGRLHPQDECRPRPLTQGQHKPLPYLQNQTDSTILSDNPTWTVSVINVDGNSMHATCVRKNLSEVRRTKVNHKTVREPAALQISRLCHSDSSQLDCGSQCIADPAGSGQDAVGSLQNSSGRKIRANANLQHSGSARLFANSINQVKADKRNKVNEQNDKVSSHLSDFASSDSDSTVSGQSRVSPVFFLNDANCHVTKTCELQESKLVDSRKVKDRKLPEGHAPDLRKGQMRCSNPAGVHSSVSHSFGVVSPVSSQNLKELGQESCWHKMDNHKNVVYGQKPISMEMASPLENPSNHDLKSMKSSTVNQTRTKIDNQPGPTLESKKTSTRKHVDNHFQKHSELGIAASEKLSPKFRRSDTSNNDTKQAGNRVHPHKGKNQQTGKRITNQVSKFTHSHAPAKEKTNSINTSNEMCSPRMHESYVSLNYRSSYKHGKDMASSRAYEQNKTFNSSIRNTSQQQGVSEVKSSHSPRHENNGAGSCYADSAVSLQWESDWETSLCDSDEELKKISPKLGLASFQRCSSPNPIYLTEHSRKHGKCPDLIDSKPSYVVAKDSVESVVPPDESLKQGSIGERNDVHSDKSCIAAILLHPVNVEVKVHGNSPGTGDLNEMQLQTRTTRTYNGHNNVTIIAAKDDISDCTPVGCEENVLETSSGDSNWSVCFDDYSEWKLKVSPQESSQEKSEHSIEGVVELKALSCLAKSVDALNLDVSDHSTCSNWSDHLPNTEQVKEALKTCSYDGSTVPITNTLAVHDATTELDSHRPGSDYYLSTCSAMEQMNENDLYFMETNGDCFHRDLDGNTISDLQIDEELHMVVNNGDSRFALEEYENFEGDEIHVLVHSQDFTQPPKCALETADLNISEGSDHGDWSAGSGDRMEEFAEKLLQDWAPEMCKELGQLSAAAPGGQGLDEAEQSHGKGSDVSDMHNSVGSVWKVTNRSKGEARDDHDDRATCFINSHSNQLTEALGRSSHALVASIDTVDCSSTGRHAQEQGKYGRQPFVHHPRHRPVDIPLPEYDRFRDEMDMRPPVPPLEDWHQYSRRHEHVSCDMCGQDDGWCQCSMYGNIPYPDFGMDTKTHTFQNHTPPEQLPHGLYGHHGHNSPSFRGRRPGWNFRSTHDVPPHHRFMHGDIQNPEQVSAPPSGQKCLAANVYGEGDQLFCPVNRRHPDMPELIPDTQISDHATWKPKNTDQRVRDCQEKDNNDISQLNCGHGDSAEKKGKQLSSEDIGDCKSMNAEQKLAMHTPSLASDACTMGSAQQKVKDLQDSCSAVCLQERVHADNVRDETRESRELSSEKNTDRVKDSPSRLQQRKKARTISPTRSGDAEVAAGRSEEDCLNTSSQENDNAADTCSNKSLILLANSYQDCSDYEAMEGDPSSSAVPSSSTCSKLDNVINNVAKEPFGRGITNSVSFHTESSSSILPENTRVGNNVSLPSSGRGLTVSPPSQSKAKPVGLVTPIPQIGKIQMGWKKIKKNVALTVQEETCRRAHQQCQTSKSNFSIIGRLPGSSPRVSAPNIYAQSERHFTRPSTLARPPVHSSGNRMKPVEKRRTSWPIPGAKSCLPNVSSSGLHNYPVPPQVHEKSQKYNLNPEYRSRSPRQQFDREEVIVACMSGTGMQETGLHNPVSRQSEISMIKPFEYSRSSIPCSVNTVSLGKKCESTITGDLNGLQESNCSAVKTGTAHRITSRWDDADVPNNWEERVDLADTEDGEVKDEGCSVFASPSGAREGFHMTEPSLQWSLAGVRNSPSHTTKIDSNISPVASLGMSTTTGSSPWAFRADYGGCYDTSMTQANPSCTINSVNPPPMYPRLRSLYSYPSSSSSLSSEGGGGLASVEWTSWKTLFKRRYNKSKVQYIDTHCHLDFLFNRSNFIGTFSKFKIVNEETFPDNFEGCVAVFCDPRSFKKDGGLWKDLLKEKDVYGAIGCHPKSATDFTPFAEENLREMLNHEKVVALGEIGLDYSGTFSFHAEVQKNVFRKQCKMAQELRKPLVIHSRDAEQDTIALLQECVPANYKMHRHCFTGTWEEAENWLKKFPNSFMGLTPMITYSGERSTGPRDVARRIPLEKLLLETDTPYFLPRKVPRDVQHSHPGMAITVAYEVAYLKGISVDQVLSMCRGNTHTMYGI